VTNFSARHLDGSRKLLKKARIDVMDSHPALGLTHEKSMVVGEPDRICEIALRGDHGPHRNARLRHGNLAQTRSGGSACGIRGGRERCAERPEFAWVGPANHPPKLWLR
jgi:hypothetical protein